MTQPKSYKLGRKAVAYYNDNALLIGEINPVQGETVDQKILKWLNADQSGVVGTGWTTKAGNMTNVRLLVSSTFADGTTRETAEEGFESQIPVLRGGSVTFGARWKVDDPDAAANVMSFTAVLMDAWENDKPIGMVFLDQSRDKTLLAQNESIICQGLAANFSVSFDKDEALRDVQRKSVTLTIADTAKWYKETITNA